MTSKHKFDMDEGMKLVEGIASSMSKKHVLDYKELVGVGYIALIEATGKYNNGHKKGASFKTYAGYRIKSAMLEEMRYMDKYPKYGRRNIEDIPERSKEMAGSRGKVTYININDLAQYDDSHLTNEELIQNSDILIDEKLENKEINEALQKKIKHLKPRYRDVIQLYYYIDMTCREIGDILGITRSRVSQIKEKSIKLLRRKMSKFRDY